MTGDSAAVRAISPRFASVSVAQSAPATVPPERAAEVCEKAERVTAKAEAHFEKHRQLWTNRQYGQLLARDGERMAFRPNGMADDRKAHLMRAADHLVRQKQVQRISKIARAAQKMMMEGQTNRRQHEMGR
ncbi:hypothetical protein HNO88_001492 [Novosphingobium chloroacetimidivorans]|uniref:Uncharacterized protein n=1 Tax=Novosphingobium chloroacetimidivorans TaxID=1428314 RepID=A0A7W7NV38_9SPHN|nr:hypothetical protein [Novosphingobium chloroacetimidivorans]MBB4858173.1 hypothetical protein [Novosphingobium chloroacetimidivorans]